MFYVKNLPVQLFVVAGVITVHDSQSGKSVS